MHADAVGNYSLKLKSVFPPHFSEHLQCPDIFNPSMRTSILEIKKSHWKPNLKNGSWVGGSIPVQELFFMSCLTECSVTWSVGMADEKLLGQSSGPSTHNFT